jgi:hypothetical protein
MAASEGFKRLDVLPKFAPNLGVIDALEVPSRTVFAPPDTRVSPDSSDGLCPGAAVTGPHRAKATVHVSSFFPAFFQPAMPAGIT